MYSEIRDDSTIRPAPSGKFRRKVPAGSARCSSIRSMAVRIAAKAGAISPTNCSPSADRATLRVVRLNRRTPNRASRAATAWLSGEEDMSSSRAATRKPPWRATATTASSSSWLALIARFLASICAILIVLSDQSLDVTFPFTNQRRRVMRTIDTVYIDGQFVTPHGEELFDLFNPATEEKIGQVRLGDAVDAQAAVAAARRAFPAYSRTSKAERIVLLRRLHDAVAARTDVLAAAMSEEYGAPQSFVGFSVAH